MFLILHGAMIEIDNITYFGHVESFENRVQYTQSRPQQVRLPDSLLNALEFGKLDVTVDRIVIVVKILTTRMHAMIFHLQPPLPCE